jgi:hypothetical protein
MLHRGRVARLTHRRDLARTWRRAQGSTGQDSRRRKQDARHGPEDHACMRRNRHARAYLHRKALGDAMRALRLPGHNAKSPVPRSPQTPLARPSAQEGMVTRAQTVGLGAFFPIGGSRGPEYLPRPALLPSNGDCKQRDARSRAIIRARYASHFGCFLDFCASCLALRYPIAWQHARTLSGRLPAPIKTRLVAQAPV